MRSDQSVKCCRCRHVHQESDRVEKAPSKAKAGALVMTQLVCPKCGANAFYELREQIAWCWASGLIEIGDEMPKDSSTGGAIEIARGPKYALRPLIAVVARHGKGESAGQFLVPGVPEAEGQNAKGDALAAFLRWCNARKRRDGVTFAREFT